MMKLPVILKQNVATLKLCNFKKSTMLQTNVFVEQNVN